MKIKSKEVLETHKLARKEALEGYLSYKNGKVSIAQFWEFISHSSQVKWIKFPIRTHESLLAVPAEEEIVAQVDDKKIVLEKGHNVFAMILADAKGEEMVQKLLLGMDCQKILYKSFAFYACVLNDSLKGGEIEPMLHEKQWVEKMIKSHHASDLLNDKYKNVEEEKGYVQKLKEISEKYPVPQPKSQIATFIEKWRPKSGEKKIVAEQGDKSQDDTLLMLLIGILLGMAISYLTRSKVYCSGSHLPMFSCKVNAKLSDVGLQALEKVMMQNINEIVK